MIPVPRTDVEELKDIFREHGHSSCLAMKDVAADTELKQVSLSSRHCSKIRTGRINISELARHPDKWSNYIQNLHAWNIPFTLFCCPKF